MRVSKKNIFILCLFLPFYLKEETQRILGYFQGRFDVLKFQASYPYYIFKKKKERNLVLHKYTHRQTQQCKKRKGKKKKKRLREKERKRLQNQIKKNEVLSYKLGKSRKVLF